MRTFPLNVVAVAAMLVVCGAAKAQTTTELNKVTVTGEGDKLGTGLIMEEDAPKARSSVSKAQLEKTRSSGNPFQALALLPGINSSSFDATGLFGGNLRVRGFNSDQMGFTVNGAPVNDSGSFSVFPTEYVDQENLCSLYVTQGAPDADAPHIGASGGNVGLVSCAPEDKQRTRIAVSAGQLRYYRMFGRVDTGKIGDFKGFASISQSGVDKWKGQGNAKRQHIDLGAEYDLGGGNKLSSSVLYNRQLNNNFQTFNQAQWAANGYYADYTSVVPQHATPVAGTKQTDANPNPQYFAYALNPFENYLASAKGTFVLNDRLSVDVSPYFWYGYGTGGVQQTTLNEGGGSTSVHGGIADINGDGDTLDTVLVYRGSLTETFRPGVTASATYVLDHQKINFGVWLERARHRQTQPATRVTNAGSVADIWLGSDLLYYADGSLYQGRNQFTVTTGESVFVQDTIDLLDNKVQVVPGFSFRRAKRDFYNYANSGSAAFANTASGATTAITGLGSVDYKVSNTYSKPLPSLSLSYKPDTRLQLFTSVARNFKVPGNFEYQNLASSLNTTVVNGVATSTGPLLPVTVNPETSINVDLGARYRADLFRASGTVFYTKFKDRIASSFDASNGLTHDFNVGDSKTKGVELEAGTVPIGGFSAYGSLTYTKSTLDSNIAANLAQTVFYPTAGKQFPDTPKGMAAASLQYAAGPALYNLSAKYTTGRTLTLTNDVAIPGFTTFDFNAGWKLPDFAGTGFKNAIIRLNVSNLFNKQYFIANAGSGSNIQTANANILTGAATTPFYYAGAPRFSSVTFQVDY